MSNAAEMCTTHPDDIANRHDRRVSKRNRIGLRLAAVFMAASGLAACGESDEDKAADALCTEWSWDASLSDEANRDALSNTAANFDLYHGEVIDRAEEQCPGHFDEYDDYVDEQTQAELRGDHLDPEVADNGPRTYTADSFTTEQQANFVVSLRDIEPRFEDEDREVLMALGTEVCEAMSNGNSREDVIEVTVAISGWDGMQAAALAVAADEYLC